MSWISSLKDGLPANAASADEIYPGGFHALMRHRNSKRRPFSRVEEVLPQRDVDLAVLASRIVTPPEDTYHDYEKRDFHAKRANLQPEFVGQSELALLHALTIASLRRRDSPEVAAVLFLRIWEEHGADLVQTLSVRWQISAATTFADHGANMTQRSLGMGLSVMFDMIKLHDTERRLSGQPGRRPFRRKRGRELDGMPFGLDAYSFRSGDLDRNMLARFWELSEEDATIAPLARSMLRLAITDRRTIFARARRIMKRKSEAAKK